MERRGENVTTKTLTAKEKIDGCEKGINQHCLDLVWSDLSSGTFHLRPSPPDPPRIQKLPRIV